MIDLQGKNVVVTGKIDGESRQTAEQKLREAGALVQSTVTSSTDLLVTGARVGATKIRKAEALDVNVIAWDDLMNGPRPSGRVSTSRRKAAAKRAAVPARQIGPQLAKKGPLPKNDDDEWLFEIKWDGFRAVATIHEGAVVMQSRSGKSEYSESYPEVAAELAGLPNCVLDGELVVLGENGDTSFEALAGGHGSGSMIAFDLLEVEGNDLRQQPLTVRRQLLSELIEPLTSVGLSPAFDDGRALLEFVTKRELEGIVAKRKRSPYQEGARNDSWVKVKVRNEQEFIVVGWTPGEGARDGTIGSLVLAYNDDKGNLVYAGRAGSGLPEDRIAQIEAGFVPRPKGYDAKTLAGVQRAPKRTTWVEPRVVVQVAFQRWTNDDVLWHPSVKGLRNDKAPGDVRRES